MNARLLAFILPLVVIFVAALAWPTPPMPDPPPQETQVLVFSKTAGYRHSSIETGQEALRKLGEEKGFSVTTTEDASVFTEETLSQYHVVVFLSTTQDVLDDAQQAQFERYIKAGGGYVGIHAASDTEYDWPWYGGLVGGYFDGHPNGPNVREATLTVVEPDHPSTKDLPETFAHTDEWYDHKDIHPGVNVLLTLDETTYKKPEENPSEEPHPIAWYHEYDGGRAFYTNLGHAEETYTNPLFLAHLWGGLQYALGEGNLPDYSRLGE